MANKMRISMDKKYIEEYQIDRVKSDINEFRKTYVDRDLYIAFDNVVDMYDRFHVYNPEIITCNVTAMDSGWAMGNVTVFEVNMIIDDYRAMYKLHFWVDSYLVVDTRDISTVYDDSPSYMYNITKYERV